MTFKVLRADLWSPSSEVGSDTNTKETGKKKMSEKIEMLKTFAQE
jgi:hypothetical protein